MAKAVTNMPASIREKLLNLARAENQVFDVILVRYGLERFLSRLAQSEHRDSYVLKGGMLVTAWIDDGNRVTRDADFLGFGDAEEHDLLERFKTIMSMEDNDGLRFDTDALRATAIREQGEYGGVRLTTTAYLGNTRIPITLDIGFGDALADPTQFIDYPTLLGSAPPRVRAYPPATVVAEKFQAMVSLGVVNTRMKDYYDLWTIPKVMPIAADDLDAAIQATFNRRQTDIPTTRPPGLSEEFYNDAGKQRQWAAYARSINLDDIALGEVISAIWDYIGPSCERLSHPI
ncbi:hypothetical protein ABI_00530 [Asticcacaulis biprosthecium C19]|uniref:Nucleotidyl transferase AbiEii/AbiGii toxin family protein n=1 Tax=Asticcacaulis biprosthecium C19 TaxID=715226 RepID=F4QG10_9CAUL|nr:nucleotidyl transferase AbiEii/AbiGii toxin family protein [Asticcacaulis biprosthecium]EGF93821.1 hypothetical protein ABI_00530 [Asticcacaulis biprosthecium C19]